MINLTWLLMITLGRPQVAMANTANGVGQFNPYDGSLCPAPMRSVWPPLDNVEAAGRYTVAVGSTASHTVAASLTATTLAAAPVPSPLDPHASDLPAFFGPLRLRVSGAAVHT